MRLTALITGTLLALFACAHRSDAVTRYSSSPYDSSNPNFQNTRSGGDSDMGSAGGETYETNRPARTMTGEVPQATSAEEETYDSYEIGKGPRDAGTHGGHDAG